MIINPSEKIQIKAQVKPQIKTLLFNKDFIIVLAE